MAYIGNTVQNQGFAPAVDYFNGDGTTVTFTLSRPVASVAQLTAVIDNVIQNPSSAFTVSGNAITFTSAPLSGTNNVWVEYTSLVTTYAAISQDPSVIGDITASGGYLSTGDFGNSYIDGIVVDYVTGNARLTTGPVDGLTIYNGGTAARTALAAWDTSGNLTNTGTGSFQGVYIGRGAGSVSTNTAVGVSALTSNTTASNSTAVGYQAGYGVTGASTTFVGYQAGYGANNNGSSTGVGYQCLYSNGSGYYNVAMGYQAGYSNTTGICNTFIGGPNNATSKAPGVTNSTGSANTAVGAGALGLNSTGANTTAIGYEALYSNTTDGNTALGYQAGKNITSGSANTAIGYQALLNTSTATNNTAIGHLAGYGVNTQGFNTWLGVATGYSATAAEYNLAVGFGSGYNITTGDGNLCFLDYSSRGFQIFNVTSENDRVVMGHTFISNAYIKVAWTVTSDARDKTNITDIGHGLDFVKQLKPKRYNFKKSREDETPHGSARYGFLAQDILELEGDDPVIIDNEKLDHLKYNGESLVPVLVKAIQEQQDMIEELKSKVTALEAK